MYLAARAWGLTPSEFWDMTLGEWMLEASARANMHEDQPPIPGKLTHSEAERLLALAEAAK